MKTTTRTNVLPASRRRLAAAAAALSLLAMAFAAAPLRAQEGSAPVAPAAEKPAAPAGEETKPIVIGVAGPFTGSSAQFGVQIRYGVELAQEEINAAGGINGRMIELVYEDDAGQQSEANKVALKLAANKDVLAVIGHFNSSCSLAARGIYRDAGIVMFSPASTNATVTLDHPNVFRNIFNDTFQGQSVARLVKDAMGLDRCAILYDNDDYGRGLYESFREKADAIGLRVLDAQAYDRDTTDFRPLLQNIDKRRPKALVVGGLYQEAALIALQARELGLTYPIIGSDGVFSDKFIEIGGKATEGARVSTAYVVDENVPRSAKFAQRVREKFETEPDTWAGQSYDVLHMIALAAQKAGPDRTAVRDYLASIDSPEKAFDGLTGLTYFDKNGDCVKPVVVAIVKDGKFRMAPEQLKPE